MINKQTILSLYNDKLTLMQWLKKVEVALQDATASAFVVNKKGEATISFSILFDDGTTLESGDIILQQGESVQSASIVSGHLILTLTNGVELDAGSVGAVSNFTINESQHLIVHYQDGSTNDLGAIFSGDISISGTLDVSGTTTIHDLTADAISGSSIVERMSGYSKKNVNAIIDDLIYTSICKNGNKLTFVFFASLTPTAQTNYNLIQYGIPADIGAKLYPFTSGAITNLLDVKYANLFTDSTSISQAIMRVRKENDTTITLELRAQTLTANTQYHCRFEVTFLLSDNL